MDSGLVRLAILTMVRRALPDDVGDPDEYTRTAVPDGPAREVLQTLLTGPTRGRIEVPLTLRVCSADVHRFVVTVTGKDDDVILAAEKAIRRRMDQASPEPEPGAGNPPEIAFDVALDGLVSAGSSAVVEVPLTLRVSVADMHRFVVTVTGKDDDVILAAEKAIRRRMDQASPEPEPGAGNPPEIDLDPALDNLLAALGGRTKLRW